MHEVQHIFMDLCSQVAEAYLSTGSDPRPEPIDTEPYLIDLLHFVRDHPEQRQTFVDLFLRVADGDIPTPWFFLGFCMHELRYPEIREHLLDECQEVYNRSTFARRFNYLILNLAIYEDQDPLFVQMWPYYNTEEGYTC